MTGTYLTCLHPLAIRMKQVQPLTLVQCLGCTEVKGSATLQTLPANVFVNLYVHFLGENISSFGQMLQRATQKCLEASAGLSDMSLLSQTSLLLFL